MATKPHWTTCVKCGTPMQRPPSRNAKFCSRNCQVANRKIVCATCGVTFRSYPSRVNKKFCSVACMAKSKESRVERHCSYCGKIIRAFPSKAIRQKRFFCNPTCTRNFFRGEQHPLFRNGRWCEHQSWYGGLWKQVRKQARDRDKVCQICGKTPQENKRALDVHHIIPYVHFGVAREKEAHALSNLVSLCRSCHKHLEPPVQKPTRFLFR